MLRGVGCNTAKEGPQAPEDFVLLNKFCRRVGEESEVN